MPILESFAADEVIETVGRYDDRMLAEPQYPDEYETFRGFGLHDDLSRLLISRLSPPLGVFGVGVWRSNKDAEFGAVAFMVGVSMESHELGRREVPERRLLNARLGDDADDLPIVQMPIPDPQASFGRGDDLECMTNSGVAGIPVFTTSGQRGITTAGHVAESVSAKVRDQKVTIGYVDSTDYPELHTTRTKCADLAVIELRPSIQDKGSGGSVIGTGSQYDDVKSLTNRQHPASWIQGVSPSWANSANDGKWGEIMITRDAISQPGDSGAAVTNANDETIGHIVAGSGQAHSFLQDVSYQLNQLAVSAR